jgi:hypothetical protein
MLLFGGCVTRNSSARGYQNRYTILKKGVLIIARENRLGTSVGSIYGVKPGNLLVNDSMERISGSQSPLPQKGQESKPESCNCSHNNQCDFFKRLAHIVLFDRLALRRQAWNAKSAGRERISAGFRFGGRGRAKKGTNGRFLGKWAVFGGFADLQTTFTSS